ncbi:MAG: flagellar biosynthesis repressor FlbT [Nitrospirae bacterium]|nr:flagellar biosynthesis repressor FlbT [Nitrospirota bacterium]
MPLKVTLKPKERIFINGAVVVNEEKSRVNLVVVNDVPILREKDILTEKSADTPCKRIYLTVQLMYMDKEHLSEYHKNYWKRVGEVVKAAPSTTTIIQKVSEQILIGNYYRALKLTQRLIQYEKELIDGGTKSFQGV